MSDLPLIVTNAGRAALVNAAHNGTAPVTIASVGISASPLTATAATSALPGEIKRIATISGDVVAPDTIHLIVRDDSATVYSVRSFALYLADGTLFASYGQGGVILEKSSLSLLLLALDVRFVDVAAASLTFGNTNFLNPPATETVDGVTRLATAAEAAAGTSTTKALTPKRAKDSVLNWIGYTPANRAGDTFIGPISVTYAGSPVLQLNSAGVVVVRLAAQSDGNVVLYRNNGAADAAVFSVGSQAGPFAVQMPITRSGNSVWDAGNDGAGSGLDADLLDGQEGGWYADVKTRLGYTPANKAGDTFTGPVAVSYAGASTFEVNSAGVVVARLAAQPDGNIVFYRNNGAGYAPVFSVGSQTGPFAVQMPITRSGNSVWDAGNDGAGSGLDADLLDGQQGGWYADVKARLGYQPANVAGDTFGQVDVDNGSGGHVRIAPSGDITLWRAGGATAAIYMNSDKSRYLFYDGTRYQLNGADLQISGATAWTAGNDGSGSGMDSDLLDGQQGSWYADVPGRLGYPPVNRLGDTVGGQLDVDNGTGGHVRLAPTGDITAWRAGGATGALFLGVAGNRYLFYDGTNYHLAGAELLVASSKAWTAGNDGAGSGCDSDMLDGRHADEFVLRADIDQIANADRTTPGTDTVTVPSWARRAEVHIVGGGGGGGGSGPTFAGGGGGAGGYAFGTVAVTPGATLTRTVGGGGGGGGAAGGEGGASSLGSVGSATGGSGGNASSATCAGGGGGNASGVAGLRNFTGGPGGDGHASMANVQGGGGASGPFGGGGRSGTGGGVAGVAPGAGGGGSWLTASGTGGAGAPGAVLIRWLP